MQDWFFFLLRYHPNGSARYIGMPPIIEQGNMYRRSEGWHKRNVEPC